MKFAYTVVAFIALVCITPAAISQTQAAFRGYVQYNDCSCSDLHKVHIWKDGEPGDYHRVRCSGNPGYTTESYYYSAGWYNFTVINVNGPGGCDLSGFKRVYYNGSGTMRVDLLVYGPEGNPDSPPGP